MSVGVVFFGARCAEGEASWLLLADCRWLPLTAYKPELHDGGAVHSTHTCTPELQNCSRKQKHFFFLCAIEEMVLCFVKV